MSTQTTLETRLKEIGEITETLFTGFKLLRRLKDYTTPEEVVAINNTAKLRDIAIEQAKEIDKLNKYIVDGTNRRFDDLIKTNKKIAELKAEIDSLNNTLRLERLECIYRGKEIDVLKDQLRNQDAVLIARLKEINGYRECIDRLTRFIPVSEMEPEQYKLVSVLLTSGLRSVGVMNEENKWEILTPDGMLEEEEDENVIGWMEI